MFELTMLPCEPVIPGKGFNPDVQGPKPLSLAFQDNSCNFTTPHYFSGLMLEFFYFFPLASLCQNNIYCLAELEQLLKTFWNFFLYNLFCSNSFNSHRLVSEQSCQSDGFMPHAALILTGYISMTSISLPVISLSWLLALAHHLQMALVCCSQHWCHILDQNRRSFIVS